MQVNRNKLPYFLPEVMEISSNICFNFVIYFTFLYMATRTKDLRSYAVFLGHLVHFLLLTDTFLYNIIYLQHI